MSVAAVERANAHFYRAFENILGREGRITVTSVLATNLFERHGSEWRLIHHHASHILTPTTPPPDTMTA